MMKKNNSDKRDARLRKSLEIAKVFYTYLIEYEDKLSTVNI